MPYTWVGALGVRFDELTGLYYMRHRWYDPQSQRFISRDPIGLYGGGNLYGYTGKPTNEVDPDGLNPLLVGAGGSVLVGMGIRAALGEDIFDMKQMAADAALGGLFTKWSLIRQARRLAASEAGLKAAYVSTIRNSIAQRLRGRILKDFVRRRNICLIIDESSVELLGISSADEIAGVSYKLLKPNPYVSRRLEEEAGKWIVPPNAGALDSEYKGFRYLFQMNAKGAYTVFTERAMCPACTGAMCEFEKATGSEVVTVLWGSLIPETAAWGTQLAKGLGSFGAILSNTANIEPKFE